MPSSPTLYYLTICHFPPYLHSDLSALLCTTFYSFTSLYKHMLPYYNLFLYSIITLSSYLFMTFYVPLYGCSSCFSLGIVFLPFLLWYSYSLYLILFHWPYLEKFCCLSFCIHLHLGRFISSCFSYLFLLSYSYILLLLYHLLAFLYLFIFFFSFLMLLSSFLCISPLC